MIRLLLNEDKEIIMNYLEKNEIETAFLYGNIVKFGIENNYEIKRCADYYGYFFNGNLQGIMAFYNLGSCIPHYMNDGAVDEFVDLMKNFEFSVVLGMRSIISPLTNKFRIYRNEKNVDEEMYMVNRDYIPYGSKDIDLVAVNPEDERHITFCFEVKRNLFNEAKTVEDVRLELKQKPSDEEFILGCIDGEPVSQGCVHCYTRQYGQIGGVGTTPQHQNKGYAKTVVSELCRNIINKNCIPTLFVRKNNIPAVKAYERLGFKRYDDYQMVWY